MARAKVVPKQPVVKQPFTPHHLLLPVEPLDCPLCVEPLDATDQDFYPCPCGYQVCLFCYGRLQTEYNNMCPGCRQQYSDDLEGVRQQVAKKLQQQKAESAQRSAMAGSSHLHGHHQQHHTTHHGHTTHTAGRAKLPGNAAKQRAQHADSGHGHGRNAAHAAADANSSLPPTASWAVASAAAGTSATTSNAEILAAQQQYQQQQQQQQQEPPPPATGDESAWPSLGAAQQQPPQQQPQRESAPANERRRSSSSSLNAISQQRLQQRLDASRSSFESAASTHTMHSEHQQEAHNSDLDAQSGTTQDQQDAQQQQMGRSSSGFTSVEVSTVVKGKRHDVCVHVSHAEEVTVYPEAAGLLDMLQAAVHNSKLSSTEAAVQLVQCLRKLEADSNGSKQSNWLQQVLAARGANGSLAQSAARPPAATRAPPPGFGPTPAKAAANNVSSAAHHHHQQQHHELPPAGWSAAHRAQLQLQQQQQAAQHSSETPQGSMHSMDSTNSLFSQGSSLSQSVWTDNGLPGVDLGLGSARLAGGLGAPGLPAAVPARLQTLWANGANSTNSTTANGVNGLGYSNTTSTTTMTGPPPGFGGFAGVGGLGSRLNGTYNPLSFANMGAAQQGGSNIGLPPGFGLTAGDAAAAKQQQLQASSYQPF